MKKKIMDLIPEQLHQELRDEVIADLKAQGWHISQAPQNQNSKGVDDDIKDWAKANKEKAATGAATI